MIRPQFTVVDFTDDEEVQGSDEDQAQEEQEEGKGANDDSEGSESEYLRAVRLGVYSEDERKPRMQAVDATDYEAIRKEIWEDNRVNFARMFLNKGEPYTLRKYKAIFKREMTKRPDLYDVLDANGNPKNKIDGIVAEDMRYAHTIKEKL